MSEYNFYFAIEPVPAARPRVAKGGWAYYPAKYTAYKKRLSQMFKQAMDGKALVAVPAEVTIHVMPRRPKTSKLPFPKPDSDNYAKAVLDAMNEMVLEDDWHVDRLTVVKKWNDLDRDELIVSVKF